MFLLYRIVEGKWLPVLTQPEDCPTPIAITVLGPKDRGELLDWIQRYCSKYGENPCNFALRSINVGPVPISAGL